MPALIPKGQRVRLEGWEQTHWIAEVTMESFSYNSQREIEFRYRDGKVVQSWAKLTGRIWTRSDWCSLISISPEEISWESMDGDRWRITPLAD